ncbi:MAG: hypothetical protein R3324_00175 [Halobacteriales archaeon]|nr:hypothetical protein [Halobacteriales archaeon]
MTVQRTDIPDDATLKEMDRNDLRSLASNFAIPADKEQSRKRLIANLRRMREGGTVLQCPTDDYRWTFNGDAEVRTSCPRCGATVRIEKNTVKPRV